MNIDWWDFQTLAIATGALGLVCAFIAVILALLLWLGRWD